MIKLTKQERGELKRHRTTLSQMTGRDGGPFASDCQRRVAILDGILARDAASRGQPPGHIDWQPASISPGGVEERYLLVQLDIEGALTPEVAYYDPNEDELGGEPFVDALTKQPFDFPVVWWGEVPLLAQTTEETNDE